MGGLGAETRDHGEVRAPLRRGLARLLQVGGAAHLHSVRVVLGQLRGELRRSCDILSVRLLDGEEREREVLGWFAVVARSARGREQPMEVREPRRGGAKSDRLLRKENLLVVDIRGATLVGHPWYVDARE